jgi:prepilin-type N-terminal cleavage/methylation domain-containing protein
MTGLKSAEPNRRNRQAAMQPWAAQKGFTLLEMLIAATVFILVAGATFSLLGLAQQRYQTDSRILASFQEARLGVDQIVRDVNDAGYPPRNHFSVLPSINFYATTPFAWSSGYPGTPCLIGTTCASPGDFDLIIETDIDPENSNGVEWVRYQLPAGTTTLLRGVVPKALGDPAAALPPSAMLPYVTNVMNNAPGGQIAAIQALYPAMFPGGNPVPLFAYTCETGGGTPLSCATAGGFNAPANILDVEITLIVQATAVDQQTGRARLVELHGRGRRVNPNQ